MKPRTTTPAAADLAKLATIDLDLLAELFDQSPDVAFFVKDAAGRYLAVNDSLAARHGLKSKSQAIGKRPAEICPGDFGRIPTEQDHRILQTGRSLLNHLEMQWHEPHDPVWCLTTKLPVRDASGRVVGIVGFSRDVRQPVERQQIPPGLVSVLAEFETNLAADITPAALASSANLSPQRLARLMKRLFDLTPQQFLTKTRVAAAARMLRDTDRGVADIAQASGFYDHSAFTRAFRAATGVTPTAYRHAGER